MKKEILLFAGVAIAAGALIYFKGVEPEKPPAKPDVLPPIGGQTTRRPPAGFPGGGGMPPMPGGGMPRISMMPPTEMLSEFAEELGLSPRETEEFLEALKKANEGMIDLAKVDVNTGLPALPTPDEMMEHVEERERLLTGELGEDGYKKFKAFTSTIGVRQLIGKLDEGGKGLGLSSEEKASILNGAYEDMQAGDVPLSPDEMSKKMTSAVLKRSAEFLSEADQKRFAEGLKEGGVMGMGPGVKLPPGLPPIPQPGDPGLPGGTPGIPGGGPPVPAIP